MGCAASRINPTMIPKTVAEITAKNDTLSVFNSPTKNARATLSLEVNAMLASPISMLDQKLSAVRCSLPRSTCRIEFRHSRKLRLTGLHEVVLKMKSNQRSANYSFSAPENRKACPRIGRAGFLLTSGYDNQRIGGA